MPAIAKLQLQRNNTCITIIYAGGAPEIEQLQLQQDELLFYMTDPIHGQYEKDKWSHSIYLIYTRHRKTHYWSWNCFTRSIKYNQ